MIDRRLYLPETTWCDRPDRLTEAGVPDQVGFATKPALARQMIVAAIAAGVPCGWVTGDEVYGADPGLRAELEEHEIGYVLAVGCDRRVAVNDGRTPIRVDDLADRIPPASGSRTAAAPEPKDHAITCGPGSPPPPGRTSTGGC
jgi:SRSO17 transposase